MNVTPLEEVAAWLESGGSHYKGLAKFNMNIWSREAEPHEDIGCGTVCCIAGALCHLNRSTATSWDAIRWDARSIAGLDHRRAEDLFTPSLGSLWRVKPDHAARVVRKLIATGEVDWEGTCTPEEYRQLNPQEN